MKTIALLAVLFAGNSFAGEPVEDSRELSQRIIRERFSNSEKAGGNRQEPGCVTLARQAAESTAGWVSPQPQQSGQARSSTDYTRVTLPDGRTATALTFH
jgi:hypothetical protein